MTDSDSIGGYGGIGSEDTSGAHMVATSTIDSVEDVDSVENRFAVMNRFVSECLPSIYRKEFI